MSFVSRLSGVNDARLLCDEISQIHLPGAFDVDDPGLMKILNMGSGVKKGKKHMRVRTAGDLRRFALFVEKVTAATGQPVRCTPLQGSILLCEVSRRNTFRKGGPGHRRGR